MILRNNQSFGVYYGLTWCNMNKYRTYGQISPFQFLKNIITTSSQSALGIGKQLHEPEMASPQLNTKFAFHVPFQIRIFKNIAFGN